MWSLPCGRPSAPEAKAVLGGVGEVQFRVRERAMTGTRSWVRITVLAMISMAFWPGQPATAQEAPLVPQLAYEVQRDVSPPLRDMVMATGPSEASSVVIPKRHPRPIRPPELPAVPDDPGLQTAVPNRPHGHRRVLFPGVAANGYAPPDTNGAAGITQYVQWVNVQYAVYDKATDRRILGPSPGNSI